VFNYANGFGFKPVMYAKDNGNLVLERVAVFRSGTFRDSMGYQNTWEKIHIKQMVDNFEHLRNNGTFDDVPVRDGHPGWLIHGLPGNGRVVGWHTSLQAEELEGPHDGVLYDYLFAALEITDPEARAQIENGTWRNRSAEIGTYVTNSEAEHWPVYMGVAYVDIPAVEGLKFSSSQGHASPKMYVMMDRETGVGDTTTAPVTQPGTPAQGATAALPFAAPSAPAQQVFAVNGAQVTDPVAVQAHISALEKFRSDTTEQNRKDFVTALAAGTSPRIAATQVDALTEFALGLSPEQYESWTKTWGDAPVPSVLGNHGAGVTNHNNAAQSAPDPQADQISIWSETVRQHKLAGTPKAAIEKTDSYRKLVAAGQTPVL
jgi:hypothetical protein